MSISSTNRKAGPYSCNGATVAFPFAFKVFAAADLRVVLTDADGVEIDLVLGSGYTVALNPDQDTSPGGTVTTAATYATGYLVTLTSQLQSLQPVVLTNAGGFYPRVINDALDRVTILVQQLGEQVGRAVKVGISSVVSPDALMAQLSASVASAIGYSTAAAGSASDAADSAAQAASSAAAAAAAPTLRNRIFNGSMVVSLRGISFAGISNKYTLDRWLFVRSGASTSTVAQVAHTGFGGQYALSLNGASAPGDIQYIKHRIEALNIADLVGQQVTISFWQNATVSAGSTACNVVLTHPNTKDDFSSVTTIQSLSFSPTAQPGRIVLHFDALPAGVANGLEIIIRNVQSGVTGTLQFGLGSVQIERGWVDAPVFECRPVGMERLLCARYCTKIGGNIAAEDIGHGVYTSSTDCRAVVRYQVPLRTNSPSVTFVGPASDWTACDASNRSASAVGVNTSCRDSLDFSLTVSGATPGQAAYIRSQSASTYILVSAEL